MQALYQWYMTDDEITKISDEFHADYDFTVVDDAFFCAILQNIPPNLKELEAAFSPYLDRNIDDLDPIERSLLRLGSYELLKRLDIPANVTISEAVRLAKKFGSTDSYKYINAVLDQLARNSDVVKR